MKLLGDTPTGGAIIELDRQEYVQLTRLIHAISGLSSWDAYLVVNDRLPEVGMMDNYAGVFGAIRAFTVARYELNELRNIVDRFEEVLKQREDD